MFVRQDLPLAHQLVQSLHAALSLGSRSQISGIPNIIAIGVPSRAHLERVRAKLDAASLDYHAWEEPDLEMGFCSIATMPLDRAQKALLANYRLWQPLPGSLTGKAPSTALKAVEGMDVRSVPREPNFQDPVAQPAERRILNSVAAGSIPAGVPNSC